MTIALGFLALILATLLGWLLKQSFNTQPWVAEVVGETAHHGPLGTNSRLIALLTLLAVVSSFFALILSAYALRMELGDWVPLTEPQLLWINTVMLILASIVFQWTRNAAVKERQARLAPGLLLTGLLTTAFVIGQLVAWQQLQSSGQFITSNPANAFFYFLTGAHAVHIIGGMYVWARATAKVVLGTGDAPSIARSIELCTIYWHFLLLVWLVLFGLLLST
ncbi:MAG: cytochrome c oxidase subunit 3 [Gammaproteobacteria bacterium]|nr:cytochrome c oxidase subunit 3 [Gammaproteobacteria bacterium]MDH3363083.1 cytochrome c oxidase subunit 3 [Gammaproteobacteria bacterium]MDH3480122.1 cytochrome c oxidase subunit 3 [Gammaproteobacteria bacterium]